MAVARKFLAALPTLCELAAFAALEVGIKLAWGLPTALIVGGVLVLAFCIAVELIGVKR